MAKREDDLAKHRAMVDGVHSAFWQWLEQNQTYGGDSDFQRAIERAFRQWIDDNADRIIQAIADRVKPPEPPK